MVNSQPLNNVLNTIIVMTDLLFARKSSNKENIEIEYNDIKSKDEGLFFASFEDILQEVENAAKNGTDIRMHLVIK
jgi:hypothetical protein